jgi:hypothetical protein
MAQNHMKQQADQGRYEHEFVKGDHMFLHLQPQSSLLELDEEASIWLHLQAIMD